MNNKEKDDLKHFVDSYRPHFDENSAPADLWGDIEKKLNQKEQRKTISLTFRYSFRIAASIALIISGLLAYGLFQYQKETDHFAEKYPEIHEMESFYQVQLDRQMQVVKAANISTTLAENNLDELEKVYKELKNDLKDNADNQRVLEAMIQNYRLRLLVLQELLERVKNVPTSNAQNNETSI